jgi:hypothetical protein
MKMLDNPETQATLGRRHRKKPTTQKLKDEHHGPIQIRVDR